MSFRSICRSALLGTLVAWGCAAQALPTASTLTPGYTFTEYTGSAPVGLGQVQIDSTLFVAREKAVGGLQSWYVFFDPLSPQRVQAELSFAGSIVDVIDSRFGLAASNAVYGIDIDGDNLLDDYGSAFASGLEAGDSIVWTPGGHTLQINWLASHPGDHVRVRVAAVPEPASLALVGLALAAGAGFGRRRRTR